ncbi:UTP--glucose-1-phosphate uridylyltransferase [Candidatus Gracilibacteria bacterium]|nr:UTP--glucose-1-phosphate uridylyltransferase [Candidatus Gracilibacteria bacterium]
MQKVRKCIIPAAGFGTRFLPATKAQPKEMLPIVDKPVIQYLVEEAVEAGITDIMIVTGRGKQAIENHFDASFELEKTLVEKGKIKELELVERVANLARIAYVRQPVPRGDGDALLRARAWIGDEPCLVLFGDDLIRGEKGGATQLLEAFEKKQAPIIALERVSDKRVSSYGIVESSQQEGKIYRVAKFLEKPKPEETTSRLGVIGKYIITPEVFDYLALDGGGTSKDGEIRLADAFARMVNMNKEVYGLEMEGDRYDTGDKFGFIKATVDYALAREDLGPQLLELLIDRVERYKK